MLNSTTARRLVSVITLVLIVGLTSAACGSDSIRGALGQNDHDMAMTDAATQMMVTGRDADVMFVQQMIPHHQQAVVMADLALDSKHQASPAVQELARGIKAAQTTEIADMQSWLKEWGVDDTSGGMDHGDMGDDGDTGDDSGMGMGMGMMSDAEMTKLESAQGADFDRLWLEGMIVHHDGALMMAAGMGGSGDDARVQTLITNIEQSQAAEIAEMRKLLAQ